MPTSIEMIAELKAARTAKLADLEEAKARVEGEIAQMETLESTIAAEVKAANEAGFDEGMKTAGNVGSDTAVYTEEQWQEWQAQVTASHEAALATKDAELAAVREAIPTQIAEAVSTAKADLVAKVKAQITSENEAESALIAELEA